MPIEPITAGITKAISIVESLRRVAKKVKDADVNELLADLSLALSDVKIKLADSQTENADLKAKIFELNGEIDSLRHGLESVESQKVETSSSAIWKSPKQKEQMLNILKAMSEGEGQEWQIEGVARAGGVGVSVAELLTSDMDKAGMIYSHYNMVSPTMYTIADEGRRLLYNEGLIE